MRWSKAFIPTVKEDPQEAEAISHKLMVRAGLIRRLTAGAYSYLPMGYKVLRKVQNVIEQEMAQTGASELLMPAIHPPELWKTTGRYDDMGDVMIKYKDRHGREMVLGPTHEEVITDIVTKEIRSYKDLPIILYQIQTKFRDEVRPRFGVVRSCEFIMKDAYSFDVSTLEMEKSYKKMFDAYNRIFERCGLNFVACEADSGVMGGAGSHEFMVPSEIGEDRIAVCTSCGYAGSTEVAEIKVKENEGKSSSMRNVETVDTPNVSTVEAVSKFLKIEPYELVKTMIYIADEEAIAVLIRGDHEVNEVKIKNNLGVKTLELASGAKIEEITGGSMGFSGPVDLTIKIYADNDVKNMVNFTSGANEKDKHLRNVNIERDFDVDKWIDARVITKDDKCPKCLGSIEVKQAIEIGHTFKLGTKYTKPLGTKFLDENGKENQVVMGCYGIGVNRIIASLIENSHDSDGIIWPIAISPCEVIVIPVKKDNPEISDAAESIYAKLKEQGVDVIIDDRVKSAGIKFKDADLVGFPIQVIIGNKSLKENKIELKLRAKKESTLVDRDKIIEEITKALR